jgi:hypothetical protein
LYAYSCAQGNFFPVRASTQYAWQATPEKVPIAAGSRVLTWVIAIYPKEAEMLALRQITLLLAGVSLAMAVIAGTALYVMHIAEPGLSYQSIPSAFGATTSSCVELVRLYKSGGELIRESVGFIHLVLTGCLVWGMLSAIMFFLVYIGFGILVRQNAVLDKKWQLAQQERDADFMHE